MSASDLPLTGDYDGDGLDDDAVWRPSAMSAQSKFIIRRSTNTAMLLGVFASENGEYAVANSLVIGGRGRVLHCPRAGGTAREQALRQGRPERPRLRGCRDALL